VRPDPTTLGRRDGVDPAAATNAMRGHDTVGLFTSTTSAAL
jgi:hypothetical protein